MIPEGVQRAIARHCTSVFPEEACGVLLADDEGRLRWVPMRNVSPAPERRFLFSQPEFHELLLGLKRSGESLWGVVHSHPTGPSQPSAQDINEHVIARVRMVIVAFCAPETRSVISVWRFPFDRAEVIYEEKSLGLESGSGRAGASGPSRVGAVRSERSDGTLPDDRTLVGTHSHGAAEDRVGPAISGAVGEGVAGDEGDDG